MTQDEGFAARVRVSFEKQKIMRLFGATLTGVERGAVSITLPFRKDLTQQHGYLHAGVIATILDSACGYAALSVMPEGAGVLSIEFKTSLLQDGEVEQGEIVATMLATMLVAQGRPGVID